MLLTLQRSIRDLLDDRIMEMLGFSIKGQPHPETFAAGSTNKKASGTTKKRAGLCEFRLARPRGVYTRLLIPDLRDRLSNFH